jgi:hypothetical protein
MTDWQIVGCFAWLGLLYFVLAAFMRPKDL